MRAVACPIILAALLIGGCASSDSLAGQRTVFSNPHAAPTIDRTGIGPACDTQIGRDASCLWAVRSISRRGRIATLESGETVRLTRNQVRILREQQAAIAGAQRTQSAPPPPEPIPAPPVVPPADEASAEP